MGFFLFSSIFFFLLLFCFLDPPEDGWKREEGRKIDPRTARSERGTDEDSSRAADGTGYGHGLQRKTENREKRKEEEGDIRGAGGSRGALAATQKKLSRFIGMIYFLLIGLGTKKY